ncbi:MAG: hypothetical protein F6K17_07225 [Okeania sp. SIO3C4]|nr:hypothetical protein [Okeania sp. SIO3C4]
MSELIGFLGSFLDRLRKFIKCFPKLRGSLRVHHKFKGLVLPCLNSAIASSASWASWS